jgi:hypothetical protein
VGQYIPGEKKKGSVGYPFLHPPSWSQRNTSAVGASLVAMYLMSITIEQSGGGVETVVIGPPFKDDLRDHQFASLEKVVVRDMIEKLGKI